MKKVFNKGFLLVETLVVSIFIFSTLIFLYIQFRNISVSYNVSFSYNTINDLYAINNISKYMKNTGYDDLIEQLNSNSYVDITSCPVQYLYETDYCLDLFEKLNVKQVIFSKSNLTELKDSLNNNRVFNTSLYDFINYINYDDDSGVYRLIVEFNDNTYATLKIM